jgi:AcrR family transcriptional regulator
MKISRTPEEIEKIRAAILDTALDIIVRDGFSALTMRAAAKRLGMSAPNLYNYFKSKDEIYITLVIQGFTMLRDRLKSAAGGTLSPELRARAVALAYLDFGLENPGHYEIMFTVRTPKHDDYLGTNLESLARVELLLSMEVAFLAAQAAADFTRSRPELQNEDTLASVVHAWSLLHGMVSLENSKVMSYVDPNARLTYRKVIDSFLLKMSGQ